MPRPCPAAPLDLTQPHPRLTYHSQSLRKLAAVASSPPRGHPLGTRIRGSAAEAKLDGPIIRPCGASTASDTTSEPQIHTVVHSHLHSPPTTMWTTSGTLSPLAITGLWLAAAATSASAYYVQDEAYSKGERGMSPVQRYHTSSATPPEFNLWKIGRASCRERVS